MSQLWFAEIFHDGGGKTTCRVWGHTWYDARAAACVVLGAGIDQVFVNPFSGFLKPGFVIMAFRHNGSGVCRCLVSQESDLKFKLYAQDVGDMRHEPDKIRTVSREVGALGASATGPLSKEAGLGGLVFYAKPATERSSSRKAGCGAR